MPSQLSLTLTRPPPAFPTSPVLLLPIPHPSLFQALSLFSPYLYSHCLFNVFVLLPLLSLISRMFDVYLFISSCFCLPFSSLSLRFFPRHLQRMSPFLVLPFPRPESMKAAVIKKVSGNRSLADRQRQTFRHVGSGRGRRHGELEAPVYPFPPRSVSPR